ncbi:TetR/AcrR family transcriptional regulator [Leptospira kmetyi]|uniref:TetR/AcrR family transcriptional regulator n=1 Tax=Leptospira kmetyi TaxID=408139 RepID=UPI0010834A2E|nr:TetR/AcrR family transcriptional regulator [Leptospira kmetyi]TGL69275.1 TetR/AcrR family transcriptional regulator [Leptospira kmetyi]
MAHSKKNKAESHERIVQVASALFRESGINGIGVDQLMKEAGLTHGGFYRHFTSKDELVGEAVERALKDGSKRAEDSISEKNQKSGLARLVDAYLSMIHRDGLNTSCAVTSLAGDVSRSNERARTAYTKQVNDYIELLKELMKNFDSKVKREKAIVALSAMVGALSLSRAVNDKKLSREILKTTARELKIQLEGEE